MSEIKILIFISQIWSSGRYKQVVSKHCQSTIKDYIFHMEIYCILTRGKRRESSSSEQETSQTTDRLHHLPSLLCDHSGQNYLCPSTGLQGTPVLQITQVGPQPLPALGPSHLDRGFWGEHALLNALPGPLHFRSLYCSCCHIRIQNKTSVANTCVYVTVMIAWQETYHILNVLVKIPISMCWHSDV